MQGAGTILLATNDNSGGVVEGPAEVEGTRTCDSGCEDGR